MAKEKNFTITNEILAGLISKDRKARKKVVENLIKFGQSLEGMNVHQIQGPFVDIGGEGEGWAELCIIKYSEKENNPQEPERRGSFA